MKKTQLLIRAKDALEWAASDEYHFCSHKDFRKYKAMRQQLIEDIKTELETSGSATESPTPPPGHCAMCGELRDRPRWVDWPEVPGYYIIKTPEGAIYFASFPREFEERKQDDTSRYFGPVVREADHHD